jgi:hypothetical protein
MLSAFLVLSGRHGAEGVQGETIDLGAERLWRVTAVVGCGGVLAWRTAAGSQNFQY